MAEQNPNLMSRQQMETMAATSGSGKLLYHEVLTKVYIILYNIRHLQHQAKKQIYTGKVIVGLRDSNREE